MVITKKALQTKKAQEIQKKATSQALLYDTGQLSQIKQQQTALGGQRQALVQSASTTLGDINQNIYRAQRQQRAASAGAGLIGGVAEARAASDLESQISSELGGIIGQVEQGAVALGAQQSALNQAETQATLNEILNVYAEDLIESGDPSVSRAWGKQIGAGILGGLGGALAGGLAGAGLNWGIGKFQKGGAITKTAIGAGIGGVSTAAANLLGQSISNLQGYQQGKDFEESGLPDWIPSTLIGGGAAAGLAAATPRIYQNVKDLGGDRSLKNYREISKARKREFGEAYDAARPTKAKGLKGANWWTIGIGAGVGAIVGGLAGGSKARYNLDYDKFIQSDVARDFAAMGVDLSGIKALVEK